MQQQRQENAFYLRYLRSMVGLSWRDRVPNTSILQVRETYNLVIIDVYDELVMCAGWKTTACQSKFCVGSYTMLLDRLGIQNCLSRTC